MVPNTHMGFKNIEVNNMKLDERIFYRLGNTALDFPYVGMLETSEQISCFDIAYVPEGVRRVASLLQNKEDFSFSLLDNSAFADHRIDLKKIEISPGNNAYFFFSIFCEEDIDCFFYIHTSLNIRIWHNESLFSMSKAKTGIAYTIRLSQGSNRICLEYPNAQRGYVLTFWLNSFANEEKNVYLSVLDGSTNRLNPFCVHAISGIKNDMIKIEFMSLQTDSIHFNDNIVCDFLSYPSERVIYNCTLPLKTVGQWEHEIAAIKKTGDTAIKIVCRPQNKSNCYQYTWFIPISENSYYYQKTKERLEAIRKTPNLSIWGKCVVDFWLLELSLIPPEGNESFKLFCDSQKDLDWVLRGTPKEELFQPGCKRVYFYSKLDGLPISYFIRIPDTYNHREKYPLVLLFSINRYDDYSTKFSNLDGVEAFLCADVSGRGVTTGSYIGDASVNEIINHIKDNFSVDCLRVYGAGHSNGAYAAWIQAQMHPDQYAGIFPSSGLPNFEMLGNLRNMRVFSITSTQDSPNIQANHALLKKAMDDNKMYNSLIADNHTHATLEFIYKTKTVLNEIFQYKTNLYPPTIDFATFRGMCRKAYWVEIDSFDSKQTWGRIFAECSGNVIRILTEGINGFSVKIPPQIDRKSFSILVNGTSKFMYDNEDSKILHFEVLGDGRETKQIINPHSTVPLYKGDGILSIYLGPLKIYYKDLRLFNYAEAFSTPYSSGFDKRIFCQYPMHPIDENWEQLLSFSGNIVILNISEADGLESYMNLFAPIKTYKHGYSYGKTNFTGEYCVMQVFQNPKNPNYNVVYVNASSKEIYEANLFVRKITLSSYVNGRHPYYGNAALIYKDRKYYIIKEYGLAEEAVHE